MPREQSCNYKRYSTPDISSEKAIILTLKMVRRSRLYASKYTYTVTRRKLIRYQGILCYYQMQSERFTCFPCLQRSRGMFETSTASIHSGYGPRGKKNIYIYIQLKTSKLKYFASVHLLSWVSKGDILFRIRMRAIQQTQEKQKKWIHHGALVWLCWCHMSRGNIL